MGSDASVIEFEGNGVTLSSPQKGVQLGGPTPLVSIITPTYNHERYIGACIDSVLQQNYENWEQIIVDDGSTDRTAEVIEGYSDSRVRYVFQKNAGIEALAHTYNLALEQCQGPLIAILEGDDTWPLNKLGSMVEAFGDPGIVLAYGEMRELDASGTIVARAGGSARARRKLPATILDNNPVRTAIPYMLTMSGHSLIPASTVMIRRSALEAIGGFQYVPGQCYTDFPTFIRLATQGRFRYFSGVMGHRRMHPVSATAQLPEAMMERSRKHLAELLAEPDFKLTATERRKVERSWRPAMAGARFRQGRLLLLQRKWLEARRRFREAIQLADLRVTIGSLMGWCLSWFHCDLESLFHTFGRPTLRTD
jgi:glycosyltransferase involved in cell wall biosynthesis